MGLSFGFVMKWWWNDDVNDAAVFLLLIFIIVIKYSVILYIHRVKAFPSPYLPVSKLEVLKEFVGDTAGTPDPTDPRNAPDDDPYGITLTKSGQHGWDGALLSWDGWAPACPWEEVKLFLLLLCLYAQLFHYLLRCFHIKFSRFYSFLLGKNGPAVMGLSDNTSLNCTSQISFSAAAFQHRRAESWAARGNFVFPSVLKPNFTTDHSIYIQYTELIVISSYLLIATDCGDLFISSKPLLKCTAKELPEDSEAKSDQSFGAYCIFLHKQIIFLFLILKNHYSSQRENKKRRNYMRKSLFLKSNIKGSSNHPADF